MILGTLEILPISHADEQALVALNDFILTLETVNVLASLALQGLQRNIVAFDAANPLSIIAHELTYLLLVNQIINL